jgi:hypothetical protein
MRHTLRRRSRDRFRTRSISHRAPELLSLLAFVRPALLSPSELPSCLDPKVLLRRVDEMLAYVFYPRAVGELSDAEFSDFAWWLEHYAATLPQRRELEARVESRLAVSAPRSLD